MLAFSVKVDAFKRTFFDRKAVTDHTDKVTRKVFSRFGAFVRQRARTSIRQAPRVNVATGRVVRGRRARGVETRAAISQPGKPPFSHTGLLRQFILFGYDKSRKSVVIGPAALNARVNEDGKRATQLLEYGGSTIVMGRRGPRRDYYEPRPYMTPAFETEKQRLPEAWQYAL